MINVYDEFSNAIDHIPVKMYIFELMERVVCDESQTSTHTLLLLTEECAMLSIFVEFKLRFFVFALM